MDWWPEDLLAQASYLVCYHRNGVTQFVNAGWPGAVGVVTGMSHRGFAVALNAVSCPEPLAKTGYPVLLSELSSVTKLLARSIKPATPVMSAM